MESCVSDEELWAALAANIDEAGNDLALQRWTESLTPEQRAESAENLRKCIEEARRTVRPHKKTGE